jgi:SAM-dependent methyltransferase
LSTSTVHDETVTGFGMEWSAFDQAALPETESRELLGGYFGIVPAGVLSKAAHCADLGCGSGRWARLVAPLVKHLHLVDASPHALAVARRALEGQENVSFEAADLAGSSIANNSLDFAYSLGVLHHVPDTAAALKGLATKIKPGGGLLLYLYYRFDNRPAWFRAAWAASNLARLVISRLPFAFRRLVCDAIALSIYWPLSRLAGLLGFSEESSFPLAFYRSKSLYTLRTDSLDRFGTRLERRFTQVEIQEMLEQAGFEHVQFSPAAPFWVSFARKAAR